MILFLISGCECIRFFKTCLVIHLFCENNGYIG